MAGKTKAKDAADNKNRAKAHSKAKKKPATKALDVAVIPKNKEVGIGSYNPLEIEKDIFDFWKKKKIHQAANAKGKGKKKFYFLQGPPYTSGRIHMGHAWNNSAKDIILRFKRMTGFDVWDRAGYDMHGLPTAHKVQEKFKLKTKEDIEKFGVEKFINECLKFSEEKALIMNDDLERIGIWMDFKNAYWPIKDEYIEGVWHLVKKAHETGRLYEGFKTMSWCKSCATALAKHEQEYKVVTEDSIFVKLKVEGTDNEYLIIWTTTPWTIPFNLAVMVNPELDYVKSEVDVDGKKETWITAKALAGPLIGSVANRNFLVKEEFKGEELEGLKYIHPFADVIPEYKEFESKHKKIHTVVLSKEFVDTSAGSGLVHCAPGCGPEDYEVGLKNDLPPFNLIDQYGTFPKHWKEFAGLVAKSDDKKFVEALDKRGALIATTKVEHDYAHCERCRTPVVFRATKQWFFRTEDIKQNMVESNKDVHWVPESGKNAFNGWLENLRDNSITKQRFWGTPVPIWRNVDDDKDIIVIGSRKELEKLGCKPPKNLHRPWIDKVVIKKGKKTYKRLPDIMDVWLDAGTASWNSLGYPKDKKTLERLWPIDFILEAKEQIRGWFNVLMVCSYILFEKPCFNNVYMHGMLTDVEGVKMSKSLGNVISPYEIIDKHGADTLRAYCCQTKAGEDMNFSWEEIALKNKKLLILWNIHKFVIDLAKNIGKNPKSLKAGKLGIEEKYILSKINSAIKTATGMLNEYRIDESIAPLEDAFMEISRTYIQLVRDKSSIGSQSEKETVLYTLYNTILTVTKALSVICPYITEQIFQNFKKEFGLKEDSVHLTDWPKADDNLIDTELEEKFDIVKIVIQGVLSARDKTGLGVRWPLKEAVIVTQKEEVQKIVEELEELIKSQTNIKELIVMKKFDKMKEQIKPNYKEIAGDFGAEVPKIVARLSVESHESILQHIEKEGKFNMIIDGGKFEIKGKHLTIERSAAEPYVMAESRIGMIAVSKERNAELEGEGYAREITRRIQMMRKEAGFEKKDLIEVYINIDEELKGMLDPHEKMLRDKVGAKSLDVDSGNESGKERSYHKKEKIKHKEVSIWFDKV